MIPGNVLKLQFFNMQVKMQAICLYLFALMIYFPILVRMSEVEAQEMFDDFFEEVFTELEEKVSLLLIATEM